jgi:hypothetical protein
MPDNHKVTVLSDEKGWSVYLDIHPMWEHNSSHKCCSCGSAVCTDRYEATIVEMYDENGVDVACNAKVYRFAKKALRADGQPYPYCYDCRHHEELEFYP